MFLIFLKLDKIMHHWQENICSLNLYQATKHYYKLKRCSKKECWKGCRYVKFKGTITKWPVQKPTHRTTQKHVEHHDTTDI